MGDRPGWLIDRFPLPTPDLAPGSVVCRTIRLPVGSTWTALVNGVLSLLLCPENFYQRGSATVGETVQVYSEMFVDYVEGEGCMLGQMVPFFRQALPPGFIVADGSSYQRADYPELWEVWPNAQKDATTLTTINLGGRTLLMDGNGAGLTPRSPGDFGGEETHQLTVAEMPSHQHSYDRPTIGAVPAGLGVPVPVATPPPLPAVTGVAGGDGAHNNMSPFFVPLWGIKAK